MCKCRVIQYEVASRPCRSRSHIICIRAGIKAKPRHRCRGVGAPSLRVPCCAVLCVGIYQYVSSGALKFDGFLLRICLQFIVLVFAICGHISGICDLLALPLGLVAIAGFGFRLPLGNFVMKCGWRLECDPNSCYCRLLIQQKLQPTALRPKSNSNCCLILFCKGFALRFEWVFRLANDSDMSGPWLKVSTQSAHLIYISYIFAGSTRLRPFAYANP